MCGLEEINVLARTLNRMSDEIAGLMEKTKQEQKSLREAELKLHQEQINPISSIIRWTPSYGWRRGQ